MADSATTAVNGQGIAATALEVAVTMAGKSYVSGGKTTEGFDCSGFVCEYRRVKGLSTVAMNAGRGAVVAA